MLSPYKHFRLNVYLYVLFFSVYNFIMMYMAIENFLTSQDLVILTLCRYQTCIILLIIDNM